MYWATFWAIFSQTHPATLSAQLSFGSLWEYFSSFLTLGRFCAKVLKYRNANRGQRWHDKIGLMPDQLHLFKPRHVVRASSTYLQTMEEL
jgi:hypothetical protein